MRCDKLESLIEAIADGTHHPDAAEAAHLASCPHCPARLARARAIEDLLSMRSSDPPSPGFTATVIARLSEEGWQTERVIDLGFNLAMAAGVIVIVAGGAGLAWSLGFFTVAIDLEALWQFVGSDVTGRVLTQVQTLVMAAGLLTTALALWWWAEATSD